jgi:putative restriction endonuclease
MFWLEMSREEAHGGGSWGFGQSLWSPSRKTNGTKWAFWETLMHVEAGDPVLHLRGKGDNAAFVGFSTAAVNGFETA